MTYFSTTSCDSVQNAHTKAFQKGDFLFARGVNALDKSFEKWYIRTYRKYICSQEVD